MLISKIEKVLKKNVVESIRVFWKTFDDNNEETFGFKSIKCPPTTSELSDFESELTLMINNVYRIFNVNNDYQKN